MYFLVYASTATKLFSPGELLALLEGSRERNHKRGVTGMLLYKDGSFMQVIEGEKPVVEALFKKLSRDSRHHGILTLLKGHETERMFPDHSMGFRDLNSPEVHATPGYSEFLNTPLTSQEFSAQPDGPTRAQKLLLVFKKNIR